jgi:hypothetical protein
MSNKLVRAEARETAKEYGFASLRGAIGMVPYIGTMLNELLFDARSRLKQERLNAYLEGVAEDVEKLKEEAIDREFLASEKFSDLLEDVLIRVARSNSEQKRAHFRSLLVGAFQGRYDPDFSPMFVALLSEISDAELKVLEQFINYQKKKIELEQEGKKVDLGPIDYGARPWGFDGAVAKAIVQSLISKGLLSDDSHGRWGGKPFTFVSPSELGGRFLAWLHVTEVP